MSIPLNKANIVVPVTNSAELKQIARHSNPTAWDLVEIRVDRIPDIHQLIPEISSVVAPIILTCRHPDEGGFNDMHSPEQRQSILAPLIPHAAAIDIEIASAEEMHEMVHVAREASLTVILSFHDFTTTPNNDQLKVITEKGIAIEPDLVKIATTTDRPEQLCNLLSLFSRFPNQPLALMGMGKLGMASRLIAAQSGSVLNYAAWGEVSAPGQWPADEFRDVIERASANG
ncbi:MAG: type I 3-dehydroquinate dehydratase [Verrucomicrobiaceae bacterium]|nr:type I 3-dehydroquinate dehydratase [Verrucomicrobiaceae bacterium]